MGIWGAEGGWHSTAERWLHLGLRASSWQLWGQSQLHPISPRRGDKHPRGCTMALGPHIAPALLTRALSAQTAPAKGEQAEAVACSRISEGTMA